MKPSNYRKGLWRLADPRLTLASISSMLLGAAAAGRDGPLNWPWFLLGVAGIVSLEVAKNASGEVMDFDSGADAGVAVADRSPFSGGRRVILDGLLTRAQTRTISSEAFALGIAAGLAIVIFRERGVLALGVVGTGLAWCYGSPPLRLAYRGAGEAAVALVYGPLICSGTYLVQRHTLPLAVIWLSLPLGLLVAGFLWINEFPDYLADRRAGKRNLVVRLGRERAGHAFTLILSAAFALQLLLPLYSLPRAVWMGFAAVPFAWAAVRRVRTDPNNTPRIIGAQRWTLECFTLLAVTTSLGLLLG